MAGLYPLICSPVFKTKIWGGRRLEKYYADRLPADEPVGEAWIVADLKEGSSTIENGTYQGKTLHQAFQDHKASMTGEAWGNVDQFPLLIKLIDANDDLSVQVHPSDADCEQHFPNDAGKDESWIILDAKEDPVLKGFNPDTDLETFEAHFKNDTLLDIIRKVPVKFGDTLRIAPGTIHAMGRGQLVLEIQQPSDSTFRIYDFGRLGSDGKPRETHLEQSRIVLDYEYEEDPLLSPTLTERDYGTHELIVNVPAYRIERAQLKSDIKLNIGNSSFQALIPLDHSLELKFGSEEYTVQPGQTVILPAGIGEVEIKINDSALVVAAGAYNQAIFPE